MSPVGVCEAMCAEQVMYFKFGRLEAERVIVNRH
jgi:hypothetical protein